MWIWCLLQFHDALIAFWDSAIATARYERDWDALDRALTRRDAHQQAAARLRDQQAEL